MCRCPGLEQRLSKVKLRRQFSQCGACLAVRTSSIPVAHMKNQVCRNYPSIGEVETADPWGSLVSQPSLLGELQVSDLYCLKKERWTESEEDPEVILPMCTCTHTEAHICTHTNKPTHVPLSQRNSKKVIFRLIFLKHLGSDPRFHVC